MAGGSEHHDGSCRVLYWRALCLLAMLSMVLLAIEHLSKGGGVVAALCQFRAGLSCEETLAHPAAVFLGLPMPYWAIAGYSLLLFNGPESWGDRWRHRLSGLAVLVLILASLLFLALMERDFSRACPLCLAAHLCHFLLLLTFLTAGRTPHTPFSEGGRTPRRLPLALPLVILLVSALLTIHQHQGRQAEEKMSSLAAPELLAGLLHGDFDRFYPARPEHLIWGEAKATYQLVIIGALSCPHCRNLLRAIPTLPREKEFGSLSISFLAYPLAKACNPHLKGERGSKNEGVGECRLAEQTSLAQRQGRFWPWFTEVDKAPGRVLRRLRAVPERPLSRQELARQVDTLAAIPVESVPTLLWQGQKLPAAFGGLPLGQLIRRLLEVEEKGTVQGGQGDCGC